MNAQNPKPGREKSLTPYIAAVGIVVVPFSLLAIGLNKNSQDRQQYDTLLKKAYVIADSNENGVTERSELQTMYQKMGIHIVVASGEPEPMRDPTQSDLEKFIAMYQK